MCGLLHVTLPSNQNPGLEGRVDNPPSSQPEDGTPRSSGKGIRWHEGENFLHEFDDTHLWLHGKANQDNTLTIQIWRLVWSVQSLILKLRNLL